MHYVKKASEMIAYMILIPLFTVFSSYGLFMAFDLIGMHINDSYTAANMTTRDLAITAVVNIIEALVAGLIIWLSS